MESSVQNVGARRRIAQSVTVDFAYPVLFTRGVFDPENRACVEALAADEQERKVRVMVFVDSGVAEAIPGLVENIRGYFHHFGSRIELVASPFVVPGGEAAKNDMRLVEGWIRAAFEHRMCRHSYFIAVGGGAVLDAVGFAASLIHRGVRLIRVPTTVLAQNDAGVGVKNGVNWGLGKNALGTFAPPQAVINDFDFLKVLPDPDWVGGIAEAFKVALLKDAAFFDFLCREADALRQRRAGPMEEAIIRCAELHLEHIRTAGDPFEMGEARPLDFGHWSAHCLEMQSGHLVHHGQAVAMGLAIDCAYAREKGWVGREEFERVYDGLTRCGFSLWYPELNDKDLNGRRMIFQGLEAFREHLGGRLTLTFPDGVGSDREEHEADVAIFDKVLDELCDRHQE